MIYLNTTERRKLSCLSCEEEEKDFFFLDIISVWGVLLFWLLIIEEAWKVLIENVSNKVEFSLGIEGQFKNKDQLI